MISFYGPSRLPVARLGQPVQRFGRADNNEPPQEANPTIEQAIVSLRQQLIAQGLSGFQIVNSMAPILGIGTGNPAQYEGDRPTIRVITRNLAEAKQLNQAILGLPNSVNRTLLPWDVQTQQVMDEVEQYLGRRGIQAIVRYVEPQDDVVSEFKTIQLTDAKRMPEGAFYPNENILNALRMLPTAEEFAADPGSGRFPEFQFKNHLLQVQSFMITKTPVAELTYYNHPLLVEVDER